MIACEVNCQGTIPATAKTGYGMSPGMFTFRTSAEEEREDEGEDQRLQDRPADPEEALLVADLELALGEEIDQLAVRPELAQPEPAPAPRRRDDELRVINGVRRRLGGRHRPKASGTASFRAMSAAATVGVVVTTHNRGLEYLPVLLRSLAEQSHPDHQVTVVVDGGDPETTRYLEREWPAVEIVSTPEPRGYAGAAALGISASSGRYIAMLNDDVELEPRWLELLVGELERDPGLGFITGKTLLYDQRELINETKQDLYTCGRFVPCGLLERDEGQWDRRLPASIVSASTAVYRREAVEAAGGFDPGLLHVLRGRRSLPAHATCSATAGCTSPKRAPTTPGRPRPAAARRHPATTASATP